MARYVETYRGVVYPWLCDQMGHCNVQHYMAMYDQASVHLFLEIGLTPSLLGERQLGFADVRHEIEYKAEMRAGAAIRGESRVVSIGKSSFRHEHRLADVESGDVAATYDVISVLFDLAARKSKPFPDHLRTLVEAAIEAGQAE